VTDFVIHPLPADVPRTAAVAVVADGGEQLRCCLRGATAGEDIVLFNYAPPLPDSPYRERGAVFAHAAECAGPTTTAYPPDWRRLPQALRAYDARGWIHPATRLHDGADPEVALAEVLSDPTVAEVHSRNQAYGCYLFKATRR
jgi:uncharacterized protein DUF1203